MPNGNSSMGGLGQPGQREVRYADAASEVRVPDQHAIRLYVAELLFLTSVGVIALVLGPGVLYVAGWLAVLWVARELVSYAADAKRNDPARTPWRELFVVLALITAWAGWGWRACAWLWPPLRLRWPAWLKLALIMPAVATWWPLYLYGYRRSYEIVDPNQPAPRAAVERDTPTWPWSPETRDFPPELPAPQMRTVLRSLPVTQQGLTRILSVPGLEEGEPDVVVESPAGQQIPVADLRAYVTAAPVTGTSFRTWSEREHWSHDYWGEVVATLVQMQIMKPREPRKATEFAVEPDAAARMLEDFLDG